MIEIRNLSAGYGRRTVLDGVDLTALPGRVTGLLGPNGGGKSTLLACAAGLKAPGAGSVYVQGRDISRLAARERARLLALVPQRQEAASAMSAEELVLLGRHARLPLLGGFSDADHEAALLALKQAGALPLAHRRADELSGGELQRVAIARALAQETPVLMLDEATANLDLAARVEVLGMVRELARAGRAVLAVIHDVNLAALFCDDLVLLKHGLVAAAGPTPEVFRADILTEVYDAPIVVTPHPTADAPQAFVVPGNTIRGGRDA